MLFVFRIKGGQIQVLLTFPYVEGVLKRRRSVTYVMKNFKVHKNDFSVMPCVHPFKLVFVGGTGGSFLHHFPFWLFKFNFST
jgi:hypothetical protein